MRNGLCHKQSIEQEFALIDSNHKFCWFKPIKYIPVHLWIRAGFRSIYGRCDLSLLLVSTADTLTVLFLVLSCKQVRERFRLSRGPNFLNLHSLRTHWSMSWAGPRDVVLSHLEYATTDLRELSLLEKNSFLSYFENLHFVARGCFLRCLDDFQHLVRLFACHL